MNNQSPLSQDLIHQQFHYTSAQFLPKQFIWGQMWVDSSVSNLLGPDEIQGILLRGSMWLL